MPSVPDASSAPVPGHVADWIVQSGDKDVRCWLARQAHCPPDVLMGLLLHDPEPAVRTATARNTALPVAAFTRAGQTEDQMDVLTAVVHNSATPAEVLHTVTERLGAGLGAGQKRTKQTVLGIAHNQKTRPDTLAVLHETHGEHPDVMFALVRNPNTPPAVLSTIHEQICAPNSRLFERDRRTIRIHLAENTACEPGLLYRLLNDSALEARHNAGKNPNLTGVWLQRAVDHRDVQVRMAVAAHPLLTAAQVERLACDSQQLVRERALARGDVPAEAFRRAARMRGHVALSTIAHNENTPPEILVDLAAHPDPNIRQVALRNPSCPPEGHVAARLCH